MNLCRILPCVIAVVAFLSVCAPLFALPASDRASDPAGQPVASQKDRRMAWWREARFGMFIHWGLYAVPAGEWKGKPIAGIGEWIMHRARIPVAEYEKFAAQFNPVKFNADQWVAVAKAAGMKYLVITAKHHEGFAMFGSKVSRYNIVDATPFHRDPMKELAEACRKQGIRLCFYYSHDQDWHESDGTGNTWDFDAKKQDFARYFEAKAKPQVRELLTNYGPIGLIWFDTPRVITAQQSRELADLVHQLQPDCLVSGRVGHGAGDYGSMGDNKIPAGVVAGDWETPATLNGTWGYKKSDRHWKSVDKLLTLLVDIVSKGGNYLLNVGPTAEGIIPPPSVERLAAVGKWMGVNGESIYGAAPTPFARLRWRCTVKPFDAAKGKGTRLYVHLFEWPAGKVEIPGLKNKVTRAYLLADADRKPLAVTAEGPNVSVALPAAAPDAIDSVLVLEIEGTPDVAEPATAVSVAASGTEGGKRGGGGPVGPGSGGEIDLSAGLAAIHGATAKIEHGTGKDGKARDCIGFWTNAKDYVSWEVQLPQAGQFDVEVTLSCTQAAAGSTYQVEAGDQHLQAEVKSTGSWSRFETEKVGRIKLPAGACTLTIKPKTKPGNAVMNLRSVTLRPVKE